MLNEDGMVSEFLKKDDVQDVVALGSDCGDFIRPTRVVRGMEDETNIIRNGDQAIRS